MKSFVIISFFFLTAQVCYSQTNWSDSELVKNFKKTPLKDCQIYSKSLHAKDTSFVLMYSYEFDTKGNIAKKIKSTIWEDTTLTIFSYDENDRVVSETNYENMYYRTNYKHRDTSITEFLYDKKGKLSKRTNYSVYNMIKYEDRSKVEYHYTPFDSLSKLIIYEYFPLKKDYDTVFLEEYSYNPNKLKESVSVRDFVGYYYSPVGEGLTKYRYDHKNILVEVSHIAKRGKYNEVDNPENNYNLFYLYIGDSLVSETCMQQDYYSKDITIRNSQKKLYKKYSSTIHFTNPLYLKSGTNIPDIEKNVNEIICDGTSFVYDNYGRILKIIYEGDNRNKATGFDSCGSFYQLFIYNSKTPFILPEKEYEKY